MEFLWVILLGITAITLFIGYRYMKKKKVEKAKKEAEAKAKEKEEVKQTEQTSNVTLRPQLVTQKTVDFLHELDKALPENFVAIPLVAVERVFTIDSGVKEALRDQYFDIVVYSRKEYKPLFVIDLYDSSMEGSGFKPMDANVVKIVKTFQIPILKYPINTEYTAFDIRLKILQLLGVDNLSAYIK